MIPYRSFGFRLVISLVGLAALALVRWITS